MKHCGWVTKSFHRKRDVKTVGSWRGSRPQQPKKYKMTFFFYSTFQLMEVSRLKVKFCWGKKGKPHRQVSDPLWVNRVAFTSLQQLTLRNWTPPPPIQVYSPISTLFALTFSRTFSYFFIFFKLTSNLWTHFCPYYVSPFYTSSSESKGFLE